MSQDTKRRDRSKGSVASTPEEVADFRRELEEVLDPVLRRVTQPAKDLIVQTIDLLCDRYREGGIEAAERSLRKLNAMFVAADDCATE